MFGSKSGGGSRSRSKPLTAVERAERERDKEEVAAREKRLLEVNRELQTEQRYKERKKLLDEKVELVRDIEAMKPRRKRRA